MGSRLSTLATCGFGVRTSLEADRLSCPRSADTALKSYLTLPWLLFLLNHFPLHTVVLQIPTLDIFSVRHPKLQVRTCKAQVAPRTHVYTPWCSTGKGFMLTNVVSTCHVFSRQLQQFTREQPARICMHCSIDSNLASAHACNALQSRIKQSRTLVGWTPPRGG